MFVANWLDRFPLTCSELVGETDLLEDHHFSVAREDISWHQPLIRKHIMLKIITVKVEIVVTLIFLTSHKESLHSQAQALGQREQTWRSSRHWAGTWNINIPGTWKFLLDLTSDTILQIDLCWGMIYFHLTGFSWVAFLNSVRLVPARETPFRKTSLWSSLALVDSNHWKCWNK